MAAKLRMIRKTIFTFRRITSRAMLCASVGGNETFSHSTSLYMISQDGEFVKGKIGPKTGPIGCRSGGFFARQTGEDTGFAEDLPDRRNNPVFSRTVRPHVRLTGKVWATLCPHKSRKGVCISPRAPDIERVVQ